ncbi:MAG: hypothetical protein A3F73_04550 [Gallionellales bacterium RIFCSPLOWO2_12_FULL_59_22]|nr:MAG: hypothetical protein A3H99_07125 [Gallionellales bacterium RIFCSPLOWO2_02_FULL_59_110]OGT14255.1 MAG: hypothetical protein A3F73_04550 [Gallionellales bacterium RIFCSPLOWO2_12_FULL_59_22]
MANSIDSGKTPQLPMPKNALYRSRIEIYRILQALKKERISLGTVIGTSRMFVSHIISVDPATDHFLIAYCVNKSRNKTLLALPIVEFTAFYKEAQIVFEVSNPLDTEFDGQPAIQFAFPQSLILHHRREQPRIPVPEDTSLRCVADEGSTISFEARIVDISLDGMGGILYDSGVTLTEGAMLKGCRIIMPSGDAIIADFRIRYVTAITLPDGTRANRAGVRFTQSPERVKKLIGMFVYDLDRTGAWNKVKPD